ncbi:MAG: NAD(P)-dependent dehydrogenase (short-subunit alcohol dehydrogenase family) [Planctomycetota bacterium]|jgi:NAD(P)-dependent dehydrogenase (short-subunit alcohol dehydrogenase family)
MEQQLNNKRALVTGAASGMGRAIAFAFAREGATVAVHARNLGSSTELVNEIEQSGGRAVAVAADLTDTEAVKVLCAQTIVLLGGIDIVVNNAGAVSKADLAGTSEEEWDRMMQVNLKTPFLISQCLVPEMKLNPDGGRLIFNSSVGAKLPDPMGSAYNASKAGLLGFVRCLAVELGVNGITVNAICPGWIDTPMAEKLHEEMYSNDANDNFDAFYDASIRGNMLNARITPDNIAEFAVYLASDKGKFMTAQAFNICAGICLS